MDNIHYKNLRNMRYKDTYELQLCSLEELINNQEKVGYLYISEPPLTITRGIRSEREHIYLDEKTLIDKGIEVVDVKRGGKVTLHGPGQVVVYPVVNLNYLKKDIRWYIKTLEEVVIETLKKIGIHSYRKDGIIGVFTDNGKICALGVQVKKWCTIHGLALNHNISLENFSYINPCGIGELGITSIEKEGISIERSEIIDIFLKEFEKKFNISIIRISDNYEEK